MKVTKRETLLECLDIMKKFRNCFSEKGMGMAPIHRYTALFTEYDDKCQILREMIQALESEPVRRALAEWQKDVMEKGPAALEVKPEEMLNSAPWTVETTPAEVHIPTEPWPGEDEFNEEVLRMREGD